MKSSRIHRVRARAVPISVIAVGAGSVAITGDFSSWDEGIPLEPRENGRYVGTLWLAPGKYQYRLRIDGSWADDHMAAQRVTNPFGSENCVLEVAAS